ncbi:NgoFVII family restriction endonuclease [Bacillus cereus]|uniref:restriction endonuclease PLD domain-containing protein n=1 Tax=Bacillus tropicus TaxID=2026188 RepID=UPI000BF48148|nr:NgoFVII family restriction endonuclease [Bacillus cereus]PEU77059.1 restriction endonuclease [Bacillus anthracis]PEZ74010.1 restriction endonuclease [Bacillus anthracis]
MFFEEQTHEEREEYINLLKVVASLSKLFSESNIPYLYYRAAENIFCKSLNAQNLSRGDISFDACKREFGIGLKTFIHGNGRKYEKVAEFNKDIEKFRDLDEENIVYKIAELRNDRIKATQRAHDTKKMIYHMVTRKDGEFEIHEEEMNYIDLKTIKLDIKKTTDKNIFFRDKYHHYKFYIAKSTLYKKFICDKPVAIFDVDILDDPFEFLLSEDSQKYYATHEHEKHLGQIYLPLYSARSGKVEERSGLNQWNAGGRGRNKDEVYIPIPSWIHKQFEGFFPYNRYTGEKEPFVLVLPTGEKIDAGVCQSGGKGFMSNPNKLLGEWILRKVLQIPVGQLVTYEDLDHVGIDSVIITKLEEDLFKINFATKGSYDEFEQEFKQF